MGTKKLSYDEMYQLVLMLVVDPSSWLNSAMGGWKFPATREWMLLADQFDLAHQQASKRRVKPMPRPWPRSNSKIGGKKTVRRSATDVRAILRPNS